MCMYIIMYMCMYVYVPAHEISGAIFACTVEPRLSGPHLSGTSIIWTCSTQLNTLIRMRRGHDR